jgi:hypothetical protein
MANFNQTEDNTSPRSQKMTANNPILNSQLFYSRSHTLTSPLIPKTPLPAPNAWSRVKTHTSAHFFASKIWVNILEAILFTSEFEPSLA